MANYKIEDIEGIGEVTGKKFRDAGVKDTDSLLAASTTPSARAKLAEATGIPRETVRRKVLTLIERGMVYRADNGQLFVHPSVPEQTETVTHSMVPALLEAAQRIQNLLKPAET